MKKLTIGDKVQCRLYNTPDKHYFGPLFVGEILAIYNTKNQNLAWYCTPETVYIVQRTDTQVSIEVKRKEIIRRIKGSVNNDRTCNYGPDCCANRRVVRRSNSWRRMV